MLHLAQVKKSLSKDSIELQLLAYQKPNQVWSICHPESVILDNYQFLNEGVLVLVELSQDKNINDIKEAKEWILNIISLYLGQHNFTPEFLEQEKNQIEEWKRELTSQTQEITQMRLELETRLEQLQELEEKIKNMLKKEENN